MGEPSFEITPQQLATFHKCLSSKVCLRIFEIMQNSGKLNISAISRKAGCSNGTCVKNLRNLAKLSIVEEESHFGLHTFSLNDGDYTELMKQAVELLEV